MMENTFKKIVEPEPLEELTEEDYATAPEPDFGDDV